MRSMIGIALCALFLPVVQAQVGSGFCKVLANLKAAADEGDNQELQVAFPDAEAAVATCGLVRELGGVRANFCTWEFSYRSEAAETAFTSLTAQVEICLGNPIATEAPVNHPDSYQLLTYPEGASVGLKDKVGLGETHVILRVQS